MRTFESFKAARRTIKEFSTILIEIGIEEAKCDRISENEDEDADRVKVDIANIDHRWR